MYLKCSSRFPSLWILYHGIFSPCPFLPKKCLFEFFIKNK